MQAGLGGKHSREIYKSMTEIKSRSRHKPKYLSADYTSSRPGAKGRLFPISHLESIVAKTAKTEPTGVPPQPPRSPEQTCSRTPKVGVRELRQHLEDG